MKRKLEIDRFREATKVLRQRFPKLRFEIQEEHPHVEAMLNIPKQKGLEFDVNINLQNLDELHLSAGELWVEWFPCGDQEVFEDFVEATIGLISGLYRVVEYRVGKVPTSAILQKPVNGQWQNVAVSSATGSLIPWPRQSRVLQNKATDE